MKRSSKKLPTQKKIIASVAPTESTLIQKVQTALHTRGFWLTAGIIALAAVIRLAYLFQGVIPFGFDHGKDSLGTLHMLQTLSPKLIGPWTSIPGLYFGPGWYYLLAPAYLIGQGHPLAPAVWLCLLMLLQIALVAKFFGRLPAMIMATGFTWITISRSAWNPFPMTFVTIGILVLLKLMRDQGVTWKKVLALSLIAALGFHFSTAFAAFLIVIVPIVLWHNGALRRWQEWLAMVVGFAIPFGPQFLFELRHNFIETKAVIAYFSQDQETLPLLDKLKLVLNATLGEFKLVVLPSLSSQVNPTLGPLLNWVAIALIVMAAVMAWHKRATFPWAFETAVFLAIPLLGFTFSHYNIWYVLAMLPLVTLLVGHWFQHSPKIIQASYLGVMVLAALLNVHFFFTTDQAGLRQSRALLPIKLQALDWIYNRSQNQPFASYHYVSDLYDYSYQYLYFWQAFYQQRPLPTEFSYKPGEINYVVEKPELLAKFPPATAKTERVFFIVEKADNQEFLAQWWGQQLYGEIVEVATLSSELTVYQATPKN